MGDPMGQIFEPMGFHGLATLLKPGTTRGLLMGGPLTTHGPPLKLHGLPMGGSRETHALGDPWATHELL